ncbi:MAG: serine/threonine-protein kinase, partial [Pseudomonadota bacterium]
IVDVYDFGISALPAGSLAPWMALEWLEGDTLEVILGAIRGTDGMTAKATLSLLRPVLQAFGYAHRQGIAHRDIKPANVMMSMADHGSVLRVLDFGIAKIMNPDDSAGSGLTRTAGLPAFSPAYAAPEQVAFGRTGPWTDVHALGLMLTEAVTGQLPFAGQDMQLYEQIMGVERPTPAAKGKNVGAWEPVLAKALALQPTQRWKDADDLLAALEATVDDADVEMHLALDDTAHAAPGGAPAPAASSAAISATGRSRRTRLVTLAALGAVVAGAAAVAVTRWASRPAGPGVEQRATLPPPAPEPAAAPKTSPETAPAHPDPSPPPATAAAAPPRADENAIAPPKDAARGDIKRSKRNKRDNKTVSRSIEVE